VVESVGQGSGRGADAKETGLAVTHLAATPPTAPAAAPRPAALEAGDKVEVRRRLDDKWARGFTIVDITDAGVRLRRLSDGVELPTTFAVADVRKERKRSTWWY
jgi:hypothetical protein